VVSGQTDLTTRFVAGEGLLIMKTPDDGADMLAMIRQRLGLLGCVF
jgi:hypothetical protein